MANTVEHLISDLRVLLSDDDPEKNILNGKEEVYTDSKLLYFLRQALRDINRTSPITSYTLEDIPDPQLVVDGGMIYSLIAEGILQLRNSLNYNDAGLSIAMFDKTGGYQAWAGFLLQTYMNNKLEFKRSVLPSSFGAGFVGVRSQFSRDWWGRY